MKIATLISGLLAASLTAVAAPAAATGPAGSEDALAAGDTAFIGVTAATLWVEPGLARDIDAPSLSDPVDLDRWNENLEDTELRRWLTGKLETQAVYGSRVEVLDIEGDWAHVAVAEQSTPRDERGYPGWLPAAQLREDDRFERLQERRSRAVVTAKRAALAADPKGNRVLQDLSFNTELPVLARTPRAVRVALPGGGGAWLDAADVDVYAPGQDPAQPSGDDLVATAEQFLGLRYLWAGVSSYGFDCSGFTYSVHRAHGIDIPRDSGVQAEAGQEVAVEDLQPGDLLFFAEPGGVGRVHHVGMYIGDGRMIHAPNAAESVSIVDWQDWDAADEFSGARRMI
ncbi:C40 family peptidase [Sediminivirga luteola]|uniref:Peptidase P60 n=1 Tax=Sediminivirga luteola TaxID=1774748 RepID=A0A8J2TZR5_9MICO|nr:C40 family peptidase [Sediminivirga luteola]MCI2265155.1 C40 family peptidase [Sediminivirga luteola]GGA22163.1 peptidase P60 [Sediminivirga luteola]